MVNKNYFTKILDIGARYGEHPSWKKFHADKKLYLIEADTLEAKRLNKIYKKNKNVKIFSQAISEKNEMLKIKIRANPAMSGSKTRTNISPLYWTQRKKQNKIKKIIKVKSQSLDVFLNQNKLIIDFIKLDTEGSEFDILKNSKTIFKDLLAARCEVSFLEIFREKDHIKNKIGTFSNIHQLFIKNNFLLLNFDYNGQGDFFSDYISPKDKYGMLQNCDAVWIKDPYLYLKKFNEFQILKYVCFLFLNNAPDVAIWVLEKISKKKNKFIKSKNTKLLQFSKILTAKHFYSIKWAPNQNLIKHKKFYENIFNEKYPELNKFNESLILNPI